MRARRDTGRGEGGGASAPPGTFARSLLTSGWVHAVTLAVVGTIGWTLMPESRVARGAMARIEIPVAEEEWDSFETVVEARVEPELDDPPDALDEPELVPVHDFDDPEGAPPEPADEPEPAELEDVLFTTFSDDLDWNLAPEPPAPELFVDVRPEPAEPPPETEAMLENDGAGDAAALFVSAPKPSYPRMSLRRGEEGTVLCRLHIDARGAVERVEVVESSGFPRLDSAAVETLSTWSFEPARAAGVAVSTSLLHAVTFRLQG